MSVHSGGGCLPQCMLGCQTPPTRQTPPDRADPPGPGRPPRTRQTPPDQADPPGPGRSPRTRQIPNGPGRPPREADSSIRSMSGRYASYWNAFLFIYWTYRFFLRVPSKISFHPKIPPRELPGTSDLELTIF